MSAKIERKARKSDQQLDPAAAKVAFDRLVPRLDAVPPERLQVPRTSVDAAAIVAFGVANELNQPNVRALFELLPDRLFHIADLDDLAPAALAAWYAATNLLSANAQGSEAKLPVGLVDEATKLKARMLRVADYHFDADSSQGREVADIRSGSGYRDLAQDLTRLAKLYRDNEATLARDTVRYDPGDAARADALSSTVVRELSAARNTEQKRWGERVMQAWVVLSELYDEVTATATWLRRRDGGAPRYPALVMAGRAAPRRGRGQDEEAPEEVSGELAGEPTAPVVA